MPDGAKLTVGSFDGLMSEIGKIAEATTETVAGVKAISGLRSNVQHGNRFRRF